MFRVVYTCFDKKAGLIALSCERTLNVGLPWTLSPKQEVRLLFNLLPTFEEEK